MAEAEIETEEDDISAASTNITNQPKSLLPRKEPMSSGAFLKDSFLHKEILEVWDEYLLY